MANLIITIISIALVAVAALMGAWYGGNAYTSSTAQIRVNTLNKNLEQLAAASQLFFLNNGGVASFPSGTGTTAISLNLVPTYLATLPSNSYYNPTKTGIVYRINKSGGTYISSASSPTVNGVGIGLAGSSKIDLQTCQKFVTDKGNAGSYGSGDLSTGDDTFELVYSF